MTRNYLSILAETIRTNWDAPALTDFYLTEDGTAQDTSRGNHYTYGEMYAELCRIADLLTALGLQKGDHIAICGANSAHWVIAYLAIAKMQGVSVTVMHTLQPDEIARLVDFSDAKALFTDGDIWGEISPLCGRGVGGDGSDLSLLSAGERLGVRCVISLADWTLLSCGQSAVKHDTYTIDTRKIYDRYTLHSDILTERTQEEPNPLTHQPSLGDTNSPSLRELVSFPQSAPDDLAMICFTSGTSGSAKGVMLSYKNINSNFCDFNKFERYKGSNFVSLLPIAHLYGLVIENLLPLCQGISIHMCKDDVRRKHLMSMIRLLRPKIIIVVPAIIINNVSYLSYLRKEGILTLSLGGASLDKNVEQKIKESHIGIAVGYGMTELSPRITYSSPEEYRSLSVGKILTNTSVIINKNGEILVKGENVMLGYYKDPEATAAKIDSDGWLHTGDKGHLDEDGYLYVEGRLEQDIIVLPNGENIRPDNIEVLINALPEVKESIVLARDGKLVAIAVLSSPSLQGRDRVRLSVLRTVNPQLPLFSQLYDVEITDQPLARTEKQTIKRYLYM